jgi:hypothetical protein
MSPARTEQNDLAQFAVRNLLGRRVILQPSEGNTGSGLRSVSLGCERLRRARVLKEQNLRNAMQKKDRQREETWQAAH